MNTKNVSKRKKDFIVFIITLLLFIGFLSSCNKVPVIHSISPADGTEVSTGETKVITCNARDGNNDKLVYLWEQDKGDNGFERNETDTGTVNWTAPDEAMDIRITVIVSDGKDNNSMSVIYKVVERVNHLHTVTINSPRDTVTLGESLTLEAIVNDQDYEDTHNLTWSATGSGVFSSTNEYNVSWTAPNIPGDFTITATVTDQHGNSVSDIYIITVEKIELDVPVFNAIPGDGRITLSWQNPISEAFVRVRIHSSTISYPQTITDGILVYEEPGNNKIITGLDNGTTYYYSIWAYYTTGEYSDRNTVSATPAPEYTITFNKNDSYAVGTMPSQTMVSGTSENLTNNGFTKPGWRFIGWAETAGGDVIYADGVNFHMGSDSVTLYAKWEINIYTINFDKNDSGASGFMSPMENIAYGSEVNLTQNAFNKPGWNFTGWATTSSGEVQYTDEQPYTMGAGNVTLYAKWEQGFTINFDKNDPEASGTMSPMENITYGSEVTLAANTFNKPGWSFTGWTITSGGEVQYSDEQPYTMGEGNVMLYAKWEVNIYTITFDKNDPEATGTMSPMENITYGSEVTLATNTFNKPNWSFTGWATSTYGTVVYTDGQPYTMGAGNVTLYAKWEVNVYTITFDKNDAGATGSMSPMENIEYGSEVTLTPNAFTHPGGDFDGWAITTDGNKVYDDGEIFTMETTANISLYARWRLYASSISLASASNYSNGYGTFGNPPKTITDKYGESFAFSYNTPLNSTSGGVDVYDESSSGELSNGYFRIVHNGSNIDTIVPSILAKNLTGFNHDTAFPPPGEVWVDPNSGKFVMPRPVYWSRCESQGNITSGDIGTATTSGTAHEFTSTYSVWGNAIHESTSGAVMSYEVFLDNLDLSSGRATVAFYLAIYSGNACMHVRFSETTKVFIGNPPSYIYVNNSLVFNGTLNVGGYPLFYIVIDKNGGLADSKSIRIFRDGTEVASTTTTFDTFDRITFGLGNGASSSSGSVMIDNIKVWDHVVSENPSWLYNGGVGREDALHEVYGSSSGYKPAVTGSGNGVGYYHD